jgi:hypothetical protein
MMERRFSQQHPVRLIKDVGFVRELDYEIIEEPWSRFALKEGGVIRMRSIVMHVHEVLDVDPSDPNPNSPTMFIPRVNPNGEKAIWVNVSPPLLSWSP